MKPLIVGALTIHLLSGCAAVQSWSNSLGNEIKTEQTALKENDNCGGIRLYDGAVLIADLRDGATHHITVYGLHGERCQLKVWSYDE